MFYPDFRADSVAVTDTEGQSKLCTIVAPIDCYGIIDEVIVYDGSEVVSISSIEYRRLEKWIEQCREWDGVQEATAYQGYVENVRYDEWIDRKNLKSYAQ